MRSFAVAALAALLALPALAQQKIIAEKSFIRFAFTQMNVDVEGKFRKFDAAIAFDPAKPEATKASFEVDVGSIDLGSDEGNTEARRKTWLNVEGFPKATFTATSVKALGGGRFEARGPLSIKGVSREIVAAFTLADAGGIRIVNGQFPLKRLQYKIGEGEWADTDTVADDVLVKFRFALPIH
ncbi:MAG TPA: YceI family protein [Usitatibacter sp.]|nr:YceI family protein [Usitatibacter sp.]